MNDYTRRTIRRSEEEMNNGRAPIGNDIEDVIRLNVKQDDKYHSIISKNGLPLIEIRLKKDADLIKLEPHGIKEVSFDDKIVLELLKHSIKLEIANLSRHRINICKDGMSLSPTGFVSIKMGSSIGKDLKFKAWLDVNKDYIRARRRGMVFRELTCNQGIGYENYISDTNGHVNNGSYSGINFREFINKATMWAKDEGFDNIKDYIQSIIEEVKRGNPEASKDDALEKEIILRSVFAKFRKRVRMNRVLIGEIVLYVDKVNASCQGKNSSYTENVLMNVFNTHNRNDVLFTTSDWMSDEVDFNRNKPFMNGKTPDIGTLEKIPYNALEIFHKDTYTWTELESGVVPTDESRLKKYEDFMKECKHIEEWEERVN